MPKQQTEFYGIMQGTVDYALEDAKSETELTTPEDFEQGTFSAAAKGEFVCMKKNAPVYNDTLFNQSWYQYGSSMSIKQFSAQELLPKEARIAASWYAPNSADEIKKGVPLGTFTGDVRKYDANGPGNPNMMKIQRGSKYFWVEAENAVRFKTKELATNFVKGSYPNAESDLNSLNGISGLFGLTMFGLG